MQSVWSCILIVWLGNEYYLTWCTHIHHSLSICPFWTLSLTFWPLTIVGLLTDLKYKCVFYFTFRRHLCFDSLIALILCWHYELDNMTLKYWCLDSSAWQCLWIFYPVSSTCFLCLSTLSQQPLLESNVLEHY